MLAEHLQLHDQLVQLALALLHGAAAGRGGGGRIDGGRRCRQAGQAGRVHHQFGVGRGRGGGGGGGDGGGGGGGGSGRRVVAGVGVMAGAADVGQMTVAAAVAAVHGEGRHQQIYFMVQTWLISCSDIWFSQRSHSTEMSTLLN